jgi:hypothetical protein
MSEPCGKCLDDSVCNVISARRKLFMQLNDGGRLLFCVGIREHAEKRFCRRC